MELIATCAFGLEKIVYDELKKLGIWVIKKEDGKVFFKGEEKEIIETNLWLRCADRILIKLAEFPADNFDTLFDETFKLDWSTIINKNASFPVLASSNRSKLTSCPAIQSIVKKAISKKISQTTKEEVIPENSSETFEIRTFLKNDVCTLTINTSGQSLHKRGYRENQIEAPIKETLAAALVYLSNWDRENPLYDPFCGSGTIPIEAAMIAQNIAPGLKREFYFYDWSHFSRDLFKEVYLDAQSKKTEKNLQIFASDLNPEAVKIAKYNAKNAGIQINFQTENFLNLKLPNYNYTLITNPPYGERIGSPSEIFSIYKTLGANFENSTKTAYYIFTAHPNFVTLFNQTPTKNRKLFNGKLQCYLYSYEK